MPVIKLKTIIHSEQKTVFDLSRSVDLHRRSASQTKEKVVGGVLKGLMELEDEVTWEGTNFGITQQLSSKITEYEYPNRFVDEMTKGFFKSFKHEHIFIKTGNQIEMIDVFEYHLPFGIFGRILDSILLRKHMTNFLKTRNSVIKKYAESELWKSILES